MFHSIEKMAGLSLLGALFSVSRPAWAREGFQIGPRVGLELHQDVDPFIGADIRMSFSRSPLTINPIFDYYFDEDKTLYQVGLNALGHLPLRTRPLDPYLGAGIGVIGFTFREGVPTTDDRGSRISLNLIGGVSFDLPVLKPFAQATVSLGDIDLVTIGCGLLFGFGGEGRR